MRLAGAALNAVVVHNLRVVLAGYGLPVEEYDTREVWKDGPGSDMQPIMSVIFRRRSNGLEITFDNIFPGDDGSLDQYSPPTLG